MKILVISRNAWDDTNSIGNTLSNFFSDIENVEFANIYFRSSKPNNRLCKKYYRVTEKDILKNYFFPEKIGQAVYYPSGTGEKIPAVSNEKKLISLIHKYNLKFFYRVSEWLFNSKKWINKKLDAFIEVFDPDIVFSFAKSSPQYYLTIEHISKTYNKKMVVWIADDEYTGLSFGKTKRSKRDLQRLGYIIKTASKVYGCSKEICSYYNGIFGSNAVPLYKNCHFDSPVRTQINNPIRMVYAGNLLFGRLEILYDIVKKLENLNSNGADFFLEIYSNTFISNDKRQRLMINNVCNFCGQRSYNEIKEVFSKSDIILLIESFEPSEILKTRYSFSTKIIDCLQSGSSILAIGPSEISSMSYVKSIPGAIVLNGMDDYNKTMTEISKKPEVLIENAQKIREFAIKNHSDVGKWINI